MSNANVFAIHGSEPEVLAYAMAKYSRSSKPMAETLKEISSDKAASFLNTFYFQYGHRSIADLAHIPMVMEGISLLAAIEVVDETRWDGQERSTRYQDFSKREVYTPPDMNYQQAQVYRNTIQLLFDGYDELTKLIAEQLRKEHPIPEGMKPDAWERTIMARTFDMSRYLLPMATLTSVGQITSARTLEGQVSRLLSSSYSEVVALGKKMKQAVQVPAFNIDAEAPPVAISPTLVKYAEGDEYRKQRKFLIREVTASIMGMTKIKQVPTVSLIKFRSPEEEIVCSLMYEESFYPMKQILTRVRGLHPSKFQEILSLASMYRGAHDELPRAFQSGTFTFDIYMDIGGFRDMHRHRRCIQLFQGYNTHGYDMPDLPGNGELEVTYLRIMAQVNRNIQEYMRASEDFNPNLGLAAYLLPLGMNRRFIMKMDFAELAYIAELRTGPAGHMSYRQVAYDMFKLVEKKHPELTRTLRVTDVNEPVDFFKR